MSSVLLSGCGARLSDSSAELNVVNYPLVKEYGRNELNSAASELESGLCPSLNNMIIDYGVMRDETRVLLGSSVDVER